MTHMIKAAESVVLLVAPGTGSRSCTTDQEPTALGWHWTFDESSIELVSTVQFGSRPGHASPLAWAQAETACSYNIDPLYILVMYTTWTHPF